MLEISKDTKNWIIIYFVANDLPIYKNLQELCLHVLKTSQADSLFQEGIENPSFILFAAGSQAANFEGGDQVKTIAPKYSEEF